MKRSLALLALTLQTGPVPAQDRPLLIPQVEGEKLGRIIGRAIACGVAAERTDAVLKAARERMLARVGRALTEERFAPALNQAAGFETSLPRPSDAACAKATEAFERTANEQAARPE